MRAGSKIIMLFLPKLDTLMVELAQTSNVLIRENYIYIKISGDCDKWCGM